MISAQPCAALDSTAPLPLEPLPLEPLPSEPLPFPLDPAALLLPLALLRP